jgi:hypothetical protein
VIRRPIGKSALTWASLPCLGRVCRPHSVPTTGEGNVFIASPDRPRARATWLAPQAGRDVHADRVGDPGGVGSAGGLVVVHSGPAVGKQRVHPRTTLWCLVSRSAPQGRTHTVHDHRRRRPDSDHAAKGGVPWSPFSPPPEEGGPEPCSARSFVRRPPRQSHHLPARVLLTRRRPTGRVVSRSSHGACTRAVSPNRPRRVTQRKCGLRGDA